MSTIPWFVTYMQFEYYTKSTMLSTNYSGGLLDPRPLHLILPSYEYYFMSSDLVWVLYKVYNISRQSNGS